MQDLVELMAENTHNVWSQDRIQQGWTYGLNEVSCMNIVGWEGYAELKIIWSANFVIIFIVILFNNVIWCKSFIVGSLY